MSATMMEPSLSVMLNPHRALGDMQVAEGQYYQNMMVGDDTEEKHQQRATIKEFILTNHCKGKQHKLLTLPGGTWAFERDYMMDKPTACFIGVERNEVVFGQAVKWMPGKGRLNVDITCRYPAGTLYGVRSNRASFLHCHFSAYAATSFGKNKKTGKYHNKNWRDVTAVWLDFTSMLCSEIIQSMPNVGKCIDPECSTAPIAISYLAARDVDGLHRFLQREKQTRADYVMELLNQSKKCSFKYVDKFTYLTGSIPMETVLAVATPREDQDGNTDLCLEA